mmetsp:Transcript_30148/g.73295  ORF Transcript_30148/g.73295 Transcript_30148/m.73295 type:complete len:283 (+) Transcript_30148:62-910(+)
MFTTMLSRPYIIAFSVYAATLFLLSTSHYASAFSPLTNCVISSASATSRSVRATVAAAAAAATTTDSPPSWSMCSAEDNSMYSDSDDRSPSESTTSRREWFQRSATMVLSAIVTSQAPLLPLSSSTSSSIAWAKYGESSSMELPSYIEYLIEKNQVQDVSQVLYRGADPAVLLGRLKDSLQRLNEVPALAEEKKWTQINGLVTGPLGTLSQTLNQIVTVSTTTGENNQKKKNASKVQDAAKKVKADVLAIGQAADKKNAEACTKQASLASQDLKALLEIAFE